MERVAKLWAEKLDDETLTIHGKCVYNESVETVLHDHFDIANSKSLSEHQQTINGRIV